MIARTRVVAMAASCLVLAVAGCTSSAAKKTTPTGGSTTASAASPSAAASSTAAALPTPPRIASADQLYVSIGDSYAAGYQPSGVDRGATTRNGFAYQIVDDAKAKGYRFTLANFGCSGATTTSVISSPGCPAGALGPGAASYGSKTQAVAAEDYLRAHRGRVGLVTVSIGGNDVTGCRDDPNLTGCLTTALGRLQTNLDTLLGGLRAAAGPTTRIVGLTYPDVLLGEAVSKDASKRSLASLSVLAFQSFINPQLKTSYTKYGASFLDVTAATGAYTPLTTTTTLAPYGTVPVAVATVCRLTYYCQYRDIHPRTNGYGVIAKLVTATLPQH